MALGTPSNCQEVHSYSDATQYICVDLWGKQCPLLLVRGDRQYEPTSEKTKNKTLQNKDTQSTPVCNGTLITQTTPPPFHHCLYKRIFKKLELTDDGEEEEEY